MTNLTKTAWSFSEALESLRRWFQPKAAVPEEYEKKPPVLIRARRFDKDSTKIFNKAMKSNFAGNLAKTEFRYTKPDGTIDQKTIIPYTSKKSKDGNYVVVGYDPAKAALRSYRMDRIESVKTAFIRGFEKFAEMSTDAGPVGVAAGIIAGHQAGRGLAGSTSNMVSSHGYKTKNEEFSRNIAHITSPLGALAMIALALKHKKKLIELAEKHISKDPALAQIYPGLIPFGSGVLGGGLGGASTGALVGLRGKFSDKKKTPLEKRAWGIPINHKVDAESLAGAKKELEAAGEHLISKLKTELASNGGLRKEIGETAEDLLKKWPKALLPIFAVGAAMGLGVSLGKGGKGSKGGNTQVQNTHLYSPPMPRADS